ncbi:unnamed protein product [Amoebophrya sp. A25]|nr:unnamed protein product [Amoebophrya sp. A25]|eukprot:GSA25T00005297001.1
MNTSRAVANLVDEHTHQRKPRLAFQVEQSPKRTDRQWRRTRNEPKKESGSAAVVMRAPRSSRRRLQSANANGVSRKFLSRRLRIALSDLLLEELFDAQVCVNGDLEWMLFVIVESIEEETNGGAVILGGQTTARSTTQVVAPPRNGKGDAAAHFGPSASPPQTLANAAGDNSLLLNMLTGLERTEEQPPSTGAHVVTHAPPARKGDDDHAGRHQQVANSAAGRAPRMVGTRAQHSRVWRLPCFSFQPRQRASNRSIVTGRLAAAQGDDAGNISARETPSASGGNDLVTAFIPEPAARANQHETRVDQNVARGGADQQPGQDVANQGSQHRKQMAHDQLNGVRVLRLSEPDYQHQGASEAAAAFLLHREDTTENKGGSNLPLVEGSETQKSREQQAGLAAMTRAVPFGANPTPVSAAVGNIETKVPAFNKNRDEDQSDHFVSGSGRLMKHTQKNSLRPQSLPDVQCLVAVALEKVKTNPIAENDEDDPATPFRYLCVSDTRLRQLDELPVPAGGHSTMGHTSRSEVDEITTNDLGQLSHQGGIENGRYNTANAAASGASTASRGTTEGTSTRANRRKLRALTKMPTIHCVIGSRQPQTENACLANDSGTTPRTSIIVFSSHMLDVGVQEWTKFQDCERHMLDKT